MDDADGHGEHARGFGASAKRAFGTIRPVLERHPRVRTVYRASVGVVGGGTVALGIVLMPLPGPGILVAAGGLAILGTEFEGARRANRVVMKAAKNAAQRAGDYRERRRSTKGRKP